MDVPKTNKPSLAAFLSLRGGTTAIDFYKAAFDAQELSRFDGEHGSVVAQLQIGETDFWLSDESPEYGNYSPETLGGGTVRMVIVVDDPDSLYAQAVRAGATVVCPVRDEPYGWRIGRMVDPFGHHWEIGRPEAKNT